MEEESFPHLKNYKYGLFLKRRFLPIFLTQFLGAFNDNLLRSGLVVMIAYAHRSGIALPMENAEVLVTICSALLVMPFLFFSFIAGQLADKFEKGRLVVYTKIAEVLIMLTAMYGFATDNVNLLMVLLFISGTHSTFFGPIKYSILPDHLRSGELLAGNGFVSGGTYIAILTGLIMGGLLVVLDHNVIGVVAVAVAVIGLIAAFAIPKSDPGHPDLELNFHIIGGTAQMIRHAKKRPAAFYSILGLSWFLLVGSVFMAQFANYASLVIGGNNEVYTLFLGVFSVGIAAGSVLCDRLLKGEITARFAPLSLLGVTVFTLLMVFTSPIEQRDELLTIGEFLSTIHHWPVLVSMLLVAMCGGIYMVPLYAMLQTECEVESRSQVIAASNLFDSIFMTVAAIVSAALLALGVSIPELFILLALLNLGVCFYARKAAKAHALHTA